MPSCAAGSCRTSRSPSSPGFASAGRRRLLFMPEDEADLAYFLAHLPAEIPVTVVGLGSNLIVRDGGVPGVVDPARPRLQRGHGRAARASAPARRCRTSRSARAAQEAGNRGLAFFRGIPGAIGGALRMNGGAYGGETKDVLVEARGVDRARARSRTSRNAEMGYTYRHCGVAGRRHLHRRRCSRARAGDRADDRRRDGQDHRVARGDPADQEPHRRLDLQEPARPQGLAADRRRRLPRA